MSGYAMKLDLSRAVRAIDGLRAGADAACARALNRSIVSAKVIAVRETRADLGLPAAWVSERIVVKSATPQRQVAQLVTSAERVPLIKFGARGPEPTRGRGRGVVVSQGKLRRVIPSAFIATMPNNGHRGVFKRSTTLIRKSRGARGANLPIIELRGPSLARVASKYTAAALERGQAQLVKNLQSEFRYAMRRTA
jgi:hypothetical protein